MSDGTPSIRHFVNYLGLVIWQEGGRTVATAVVRPEMLIPGTRRVRMGLLFTMADLVGGDPGAGAVTATTDLRFQLLSDPPTEGEIRLEARPTKIGPRLRSGEIRFTTRPDGRPFARADYTFLNAGESGPPPGDGPARWSAQVDSFPAASFDQLFDMRNAPDGTLEMDAHEAVRIGGTGTIQGGAQATMAEVAAERALVTEGTFAVRDLHVRYHSSLKNGPAVARAEVLPKTDEGRSVYVSIEDKGSGGRLISSAVAVCRRAGP